MVDVTVIMTLIIQLILAVILTFAVPWLKSKVSAEQLEKGKALVKIAVQAAEMIFGSGTGEKKKNYVMGYLLTEFEKARLTFDADTVNNMIESAVLELDRSV